MDKDRLKNYIVQVEGLRLKGSGVLFKYLDEVYIFTAKHNLEYKEDQKVKKIDISELLKQKNNIKIYPHVSLKVEDVIELDKSLDILILKIDESSIDEITIDNLSIFGEELNNSLPYTVAGYPKIRNDKSIEFFDCTYEVSDNLTFEVHTDKVSNLSEKEKEEQLVGLSGGGAFVESNGQIYLLGIQIRYEGFSNLECINLQKLKDRIDEKLIKSNIEIIEEEIILNSGESFKIKMVKVDLIDKSLYVSIYPVTFEEFDLFCDDTNYKKPKSYSFQFPRENYPVVNVSWDDAISYCDWLTNKSQEFKYTLPSSEVWEKIAKLNKIETSKLDDYIWHQKNTKTINRVGIKKAGLLGIHDMYGNVHEWCNNKKIRGKSFKYNLEEIFNSIDRIHGSNHTKDVLSFRIIKRSI